METAVMTARTNEEYLPEHPAPTDINRLFIAPSFFLKLSSAEQSEYFVERFGEQWEKLHEVAGANTHLIDVWMNAIDNPWKAEEDSQLLRLLHKACCYDMQQLKDYPLAGRTVQEWEWRAHLLIAFPNDIVKQVWEELHISSNDQNKVWNISSLRNHCEQESAVKFNEVFTKISSSIDFGRKSYEEYIRMERLEVGDRSRGQRLRSKNCYTTLLVLLNHEREFRSYLMSLLKKEKSPFPLTSSFASPTTALDTPTPSSPSRNPFEMFQASPVALGFNLGPVGTKCIKYYSFIEIDPNGIVQLASISAMPEYRHKSFEELRWEDYNIARVSPSHFSPSTLSQFSTPSLPRISSNSVSGSMRPTFTNPSPSTSGPIFSTTTPHSFGASTVTPTFGATTPTFGTIPNTPALVPNTPALPNTHVFGATAFGTSVNPTVGAFSTTTSNIPTFSTSSSSSPSSSSSSSVSLTSSVPFFFGDRSAEKLDSPPVFFPTYPVSTIPFPPAPTSTPTFTPITSPPTTSPTFTFTPCPSTTSPTSPPVSFTFSAQPFSFGQ